MKKKSAPKNSAGIVYDDDTSDTDSDDNMLEGFKNKVRQAIPTGEDSDMNNDDGNEDDSDEDAEDEEDSNMESDSSSDESSEEEISPDVSDKKKFDVEEKRMKLSNIQKHLSSVPSLEESSESEEDEDENKMANGGEVTGSENSDGSSASEEDSEDEVSDGNGNKKQHLKRKGTMPIVDEAPSKKVKSDVHAKQEVAEVDKNRFRMKLSKMSIEEIQRLKNKLGTRLFDKKMSGTNEQQKSDFKRDNKNRPREMSSKKQVKRFREVVVASKLEKRDPRFDPNCGDFDDKLFKENYNFVNEYKAGDLKFLKKQLQEEEDSERKKSIKYLIQRTENQLRQLEHDKSKEEEKKAEIEERRNQLKAGIKPKYISKSKLKEKELINKYKKLKETGGLDKYISKKTKKNTSKERKNINL